MQNSELLAAHTKKACFAPLEKQLPFYLLSACPQCNTIVPALLSAQGSSSIILTRDCPQCGSIEEKVKDTLFSHALGRFSDQPVTTHSNAPIYPCAEGFPKTVQTLCPECRQIILGIEYIKDNKVYMEKTCPEHGYVYDLLYSDALLFQKLEHWGFEDNKGLTNPAVTQATRCPSSCGLCSMHTSHSCLGVIDLTNRCNLTCPICFANANVQNYIYEPSFEQVIAMMQTLRDERPTPAVAVQFSGGEPTLHPRFFDILQKAKDMGFSHIQLATNGLNFTDLAFVKECEKRGLHQIYLQFDGFDDAIYKKTRGVALLEKKRKAIEHIRQTDMKICFVPTIVKGINDQEIAPIIKFAIENADVVSAISFQPVAFTGRINEQQRFAQRFTLGDMAQRMEDAGLAQKMRDFYPLSFVVPFSRMLEAITGDPKITMSAHTHCSTASWFLIDKEKKAHPFTKFIDVEGLLKDIHRTAPGIKKSPFKLFTKIQALSFMHKHYKEKEAPAGLNFLAFLQAIQGLTDKKLGRGEQGKKNWRTLLVAGMHFMDCYNYDVERVKRCLIHYPSPEGRLYPFCTYNAGPTYREQVEQKFRTPR